MVGRPWSPAFVAALDDAMDLEAAVLLTHLGHSPGWLDTL
jgi:hypothetical protein